MFGCDRADTQRRRTQVGSGTYHPCIYLARACAMINSQSVCATLISISYVCYYYFRPSVSLTLNFFDTHSQLTSFIAQPGAAFHRACPAHIPCFAVTAALLAESVFRAVVLTTRLVAVGSNEVVGVAFGTSWATVVARADTCPIAGARAVIAAVAGTDGLCAVLAGPTTRAQAVVVDAASVSRTCLVARVSGASLSTPAVFAVARAVHATTMLAASRLA